MCITLNEAYMSAANRGSKNLYIFKSKYISFTGKKNFFGMSFLLFLGLQIYEAIAAIFWQSSSYAFKLCSHIFMIFEVKLE